MDVERIKMQQMFMTSLFDKLTANGTLENPVTLYKIAEAVTKNITVDTGLDNVSSMISIAEAVGSISKNDIQYATAPYIIDLKNEFSYDMGGYHLTPGAGFQQLWTYMRDDQPLPGSPAAAMEGASAKPAASSTQTAAHPAPSPKPTVALSSLNVQVFNSTEISGEAKNAAAYLKSLGMTTSVGQSGYTGYTATTILYPAADQAQAAALQNQIAGSVLKQSSSVSRLTLVIGTNVPSILVAPPTQNAGSSGTSATAGGSGSSGSSAAAAAALSGVQTRDGSANLCSNLPGVVANGGTP
jgi:hypothetical protein